ncbi:carbonic anhydrase 2-like isoform X1 [Hydractinia symbiolongicarpus]|uniref:carbonic anhydrase 2-like isoform X1 n=1 Tax=Hydractinia symbiolongicarpus TaxID=13093 RepID=UPI002549D291|nr:carbonic anhydrase 2-like isoform X1 [Hydractinia symbiolongicarpus]
MTTILKPRKIKITKREIPVFKPITTLSHRKLTTDEIKRIVDKDGEFNDWTYQGVNGPDYWHRNFPVAASTYQSPVNIELSEVEYNESLTELILTGYEDIQMDKKLKLCNNGCTIKLKLENGVRASRADFTNTYEALFVCFHWSTDNSRGSEHCVDGKSYPMEIQLIHKNTKYTEDEMFDKKDGLLMLAYFVEISDEENINLSQITDNLKKIKYKGEEVKIDNFPLRTILPNNISKYYQYVGSLTTPPCNECVTWIVLSDTINMSQEQMDNFRLLYSGDNNTSQLLHNNYRPLQKLHHRKIKTNILTL